MKLLILGPTAHFGRGLLDLAVQSGHDVTVFNRTHVDRSRFPLVEWIDASPLDSLDPIAGRRFDAAVDLSACSPELTLRNTLQLADRVGHYTLVSSISVYRDFAVAPVDEAYPTAAPPPPHADLTDYATYGPRLAECERRAAEVLGRRLTIVRAGLLAGPYDLSDRLPRLIRRVMQAEAGQRILVGASPDQPVQILDIRDLADFIFGLITRDRRGLFNAVGDVVPLGSVLAQLSSAVTAGGFGGIGATFAYLPEDQLARAGLQPMSQLPLWVPERGYPGFFRVANARARAAGLNPRPLTDTFSAAAAFLADHARRGQKFHVPPPAKPPLATLPAAAEARLLGDAAAVAAASAA